MHPVRGRKGTFSAASSAAFFSATACFACPNHDELQNCKARRGPDPARIWGVSETSEKGPLAITRASNAHSNLVRTMGPQCRCAVRNAMATRVGVLARGAWGVRPTRAARR
jgi:hypothetical protein